MTTNPNTQEKETRIPGCTSKLPGLIAEKKEDPCPFKTRCLGISSSCTVSQTSWCPEAEKIQKLDKTPCPAMVDAGYDSTNLAICNCTIPQIRQCLPEGSSCFIGGKCIASYFNEELRDAVFNHNKSNPLDLPNEHLKKIIPSTLWTQKQAILATAGRMIIKELCLAKLERCLSQLGKNKLISNFALQ